MKLIIVIDEKYYEACKDAVEEFYPSKIEEVIANGTPITEGDLISRQDCENCQFKKFSEDLADKLAKVMIDNGIKDFDGFAKRCGISYLHQDSITRSDTKI